MIAGDKMSKYDKERQALGIKSLGTTTPVNTNAQSKYAAERQAILSGSAYKKEEPTNTFNMPIPASMPQKTESEPVSTEPKPTTGWDKIKSGNILGGLGTLGIESINAAQTGVLNLSRNITDLTKGKGLSWTPNYTYADYAKDVAPESKVTKAIHSGTVGGNILGMGLEVASDPLTFVAGGVFDDLAKAGIKPGALNRAQDLTAQAKKGQEALKKLNKLKPLEKTDTVLKQVDTAKPLNQSWADTLPRYTKDAQGNIVPLKQADNITDLRKPLDSVEKLRSFPKTVAKADITSTELRQMIKDNPLSYTTINNKDTLKYAQDIVDKNFDAAKAIVKEGDSFQNATEAAMAQDIIRRLQNNKQWDEAFEVMETASKKWTTAGQTVQAAAMWRKMTPEGMLNYAKKTMDKANVKMPKGFAEQLTDAMKRINEADNLVDVITQQAGGKVSKFVNKQLVQKSTEQLKDIAIAQVLSDIADQIPSSAWKKVSTVQAMSHLINAKTSLRNILSNTSFGVMENISNVLAIPADVVTSWKTGKRSLTLPKFKGTFKAGMDRAKESALDISLGIDRSGIGFSKYNLPQGKTFKKGIGAAGEKALGYSLRSTDEFYKGQVYDNVLKQQMKISKVDAPTKEMMDYAEQRARYATFQDDSLPARLLQGLKDLANEAGGGKTIRGRSGLTTREFGMGDLLIKYTTVPGNLIARSVEYSPLGMFKTLDVLAKAKKTGVLNQADLAMSIGRTFTGSGLIAAGITLNRMGLLKSEDDDRSKGAIALDRAEGLGNYRVNMTALNRLLNGEDTEMKEGDSLLSYNWLEPVSVAFAIGAAIDNELKKEGTPIEIAYEAGKTSFDEILDLPTLMVIRQMTYQDNVFDVAMTPFVQSAAGFIPAPIRQYGQLTDPIGRETKGANTLETLKNRVVSNVPELRKTLEPRMTPFGDEFKYETDVFNTMINPSTKSTYKPSGVTDKLKQIEDITGEGTHYPRDKAPKSFNLNGIEYELTPKEKTLFMEIAGKETERYYKQLLQNTLTPQNALGTANILEEAKEIAYNKAKYEIAKRRR